MILACSFSLYSSSERTVVWSSIITTPSTIGQSSFIPTSMVPVASTLVATLTKTKKAYSLTILYVNEERRSVDELTSFDIQSEKELISYSFHSQKGTFCVLGMYLLLLWNIIGERFWLILYLLLRSIWNMVGVSDQTEAWPIQQSCSRCYETNIITIE
jgi:hypothetical protein